MTDRNVGPAPGFTRNAISNVVAAMSLLRFSRQGLHRLRPGIGNTVFIVVLTLCASVVADLLNVGIDQGQWSLAALPQQCFWLIAVLAAASLVGLRERGLSRATRFALATIALALLMFMQVILIETLDVAATYGEAVTALTRWHDAAAITITIWVSLAAWVTTWRLQRSALPPTDAQAEAVTAASQTSKPTIAGPGWALLASLAASVAMVSPALLTDPAARLWVDSTPVPTTSDAFYAATTAEDTFYAQIDLLDDALAQIEASDPGVPALYFLGFAGYGPQDVFSREVDGAAEKVAARFGSGSRTVVLANDHADPAAHPFASLSALRRALAVIADRMNVEQDVLFLLLSSHGDADGTVAVSMWPYQFASITPRDLAEALDASGIRHRVIVVSACHSGAFVEPLASPDTAIITASRADRSSFGCESGQDWTWFGKALFDEALIGSETLEAAFEDAARRVAAREQAAGFSASEPQMFMGNAIRERLLKLSPSPRRAPRKDLAQVQSPTPFTQDRADTSQQGKSCH